MSNLDLFLLGLIAKWTVVLAIFWAAYWSLPRNSLKARVWIWRAALWVFVGVTGISLLQPLAQLPALATIETPVTKSNPLHSSSTTTHTSTSPTSTDANVTIPKQPSQLANAPLNITPINGTAQAKQQASRSWSSVLTCAWIVVSALLLTRLMLIIRRDERWLRERRPVTGAVHEQFQQLLDELGQTQHSIELNWSTSILSPVATGIWRPRILLPQSLSTADTATLRSALAHELSHILSRDIAWNLALRFWQAIAWVCPLVWLVPRQHHEACELLADHQASQSLASRADYRQILATLALNLLAPSARRVPGGAAISMLRTPMILHRLRMLESAGAHAQVNLLTRCVFSMICILGLLLGGIGLARSRAQDKLATKPQLIETKPVTTNEDGNNKAEDSIRVLAPDGSPAKEVRMVLGPPPFRGGGVVCLSEDTKNFPSVDSNLSIARLSATRPIYKPTILEGEAKIQRSQLGDADSVIVWNDQGFYQHMLSPLAWPKELKLQPWCSLDLQVHHHGQALAKCEIDVKTRSASDGVHQGTEVLVIGQTNEQGRITLPRVPPGALIISRKTVVKTFQNTGTTISPRSTTILAHPGEVLEIKQGGSGQRVEGKLQLGGNPPVAFNGQLSCNDQQEVFDFEVESDGSFAIDDVPAGEHELSFRLMQPYKFYASHTFQCPGNSNDPPFSVGTIEPSKDRREAKANQSVGEGIKRNWMPTKLALTPTSEPIRRIDSLSDGSTVHYVLLGADDKPLLDLTDVPLPPGWSSAAALSDLDAQHHRLTFLVRDTVGNHYLCVLSDRGEPLWTRFLKPLESYRVAFDTETGNLWLLIKNMLDDGKVEVLDPNGQLLQSHDINAFTLSYCESDHTFWLGGQRDIKKVDAKDGRVLATFAMPSGIFAIDQLQPLSDSSVLACEGAHPDMPKSANRLWHIDAQGKLIAAVDIGNLFVKSAAPQPFGRDYIVTASRINGWLGAYESETQLIHISSDLKTVRKITQLKDEVVNTNTPGQAWLRVEDKRLLITWDEDGQVTIRETLTRK